MSVHAFQSQARIDSVVKVEIDIVARMSDAMALVAYAADVMRSPQARLFAAVNVNVLHALTTTGRLPGYADGGLVGGGPVPAGGDGPGGDTHFHLDLRGSTLTPAQVEASVHRAIASNNRALPGMLAERQRRTG